MAQLDRRTVQYREKLNHPLIRDKKILGTGLFSTVFDNGDTVLKLTIDNYSHDLFGDHRFHSVYMPKETHSWGCLGPYGTDGQHFWLLEMEKLDKLKPGMNGYKFVTQIEKLVFQARQHMEFEVPSAITLIDTMWDLAPREIAGKDDLWDHLMDLADFADHHNAMIDTHRGNWMRRRGGGPIVFADPLVNINTW